MSWRNHRLAPAPGTRLCSLAEVPDGGCREFQHGQGLEPFSALVLRSGENVWAYVNVCPHFALPLNSRPEEFLFPEPRQIMCAYHCAVFRFEDGYCIDGPAQGTSLDPIPIEVVDGEVYIRKTDA